jgi:hypothetical protein
MKPTRLLNSLALGATLLALLAACATPGGTGSAVGEGAPSTDAARVSTPWSGPFPDEAGERLWTPRKEGENVVAHHGVLLRAGRGWYFYPAAAEDPRSLIVRARSAAGTAEAAVHLLPEELGFAEEVLTPEYVQRALRRALSGRGSPNSDLLRVVGGERGELVFLAREQGELAASILVRAVPSPRGLYLITAAGDTPRDYSAASGVAGSFEQVDMEVSLRIPPAGPAFFSRWEGGAWLTDSREGSLYSVPGRELLVLSSPDAVLQELPPPQALRFVSRGRVVEAAVAGPVSSGNSVAVQLTPEEADRTIILIGSSLAGSSEEVMREQLFGLINTYIINRETALEALR